MSLTIFTVLFSWLADPTNFDQFRIRILPQNKSDYSSGLSNVRLLCCSTVKKQIFYIFILAQSPRDFLF
jgi:hypothetical protein